MPQPKLLQLMIRLALRQTESTPGRVSPDRALQHAGSICFHA